METFESAIKNLIKSARKTTAVTLAQLNEVLPDDASSPEKIEAAMAMIEEAGLEIVDTTDQPTVVDVDFPTVALSQARWDSDTLHLAAHPRNAAARDSRTRVRVTNLGPPGEWAITSPDGVTHPLERTGDDLTIELVADDEPVRVHPAR